MYVCMYVCMLYVCMIVNDTNWVAGDHPPTVGAG